MMKRTWRKIRANWRDTLLLFREFRQPLLLFALAITGSGWLFFFLAHRAGQPVDSLAEAVYITMAIFGEPDHINQLIHENHR